MWHKIGKSLRDILFPPFSELELVILLYSILIAFLNPLYLFGGTFYDFVDELLSNPALLIIFIAGVAGPILTVRYFGQTLKRLEKFVREERAFTSFFLRLVFLVAFILLLQVSELAVGLALIMLSAGVAFYFAFRPMIHIARRRSPPTASEKRFYAQWFYIVLVMLASVSAYESLTSGGGILNMLVLPSLLIILTSALVSLLVIFLGYTQTLYATITEQFSDEQMTESELILIVIIGSFVSLLLRDESKIATTISLTYFYTVTILLIFRKLRQRSLS